MLPVFLLAWISFSKWDGKKAAYPHKVLFSQGGVQIRDSQIYDTSSEWVASGATFVMCRVGQFQFVPRAYTVVSTAHRLEGGRCCKTALWHAANKCKTTLYNSFE